MGHSHRTRRAATPLSLTAVLLTAPLLAGATAAPGTQAGAQAAPTAPARAQPFPARQHYAPDKLGAPGVSAPDPDTGSRPRPEPRPGAREARQAQEAGQGVRETARTRHVPPVLPFGAGLTCIGLGLGLIALRLRRR